jgi:hypothetical protein
MFGSYVLGKEEHNISRLKLQDHHYDITYHIHLKTLTDVGEKDTEGTIETEGMLVIVGTRDTDGANDGATETEGMLVIVGTRETDGTNETEGKLVGPIVGLRDGSLVGPIDGLNVGAPTQTKGGQTSV